MKCSYCNNETKFCENKEIYGKNYGKSYMCYYCKPCDAYVGTHNNTKQPLGTLANKELREKRKPVHSVIDEIWQSGQMKRSSMYEKLSDAMGFQVHVGESDVETCDKIIETANRISNLP